MSGFIARERADAAMKVLEVAGVRIRELEAENAALRAKLETAPTGLEYVGKQIMAIMATYRHQETVNGFVDTPGGLEHMGDVWRLLSKWDRMLRGEHL